MPFNPKAGLTSLSCYPRKLPETGSCRGSGGRNRGGPGSRVVRFPKKLSRAHPYLADCQSVRTEATATGAGPRLGEENAPTRPELLPPPDQRKLLLFFPSFGGMSSLSRLKRAGGHACQEKWWVGRRPDRGWEGGSWAEAEGAEAGARGAAHPYRSPSPHPATAAPWF